MRKLSEVLEKIEVGFYVIAVLGGTFLMFLNVILRYFFNLGIVWSEEIVRYAMIWLTFLAIGIAVRSDRHVKIDFFAYFLPEKAKRVLFTIVDIISAVFCALMVKYSFDLVLQQYGAGQKTPSLQLPFYIVILSLTVGYLLGCIRFIEDAIIRVKGRVE